MSDILLGTEDVMSNKTNSSASRGASSLGFKKRYT